MIQVRQTDLALWFFYSPIGSIYIYSLSSDLYSATNQNYGQGDVLFSWYVAGIEKHEYSMLLEHFPTWLLYCALCLDSISFGHNQEISSKLALLKLLPIDSTSSDKWWSFKQSQSFEEQKKVTWHIHLNSIPRFWDALSYTMLNSDPRFCQSFFAKWKDKTKCLLQMRTMRIVFLGAFRQFDIAAGVASRGKNLRWGNTLCQPHQLYEINQYKYMISV